MAKGANPKETNGEGTILVLERDAKGPLLLLQVVVLMFVVLSSLHHFTAVTEYVVASASRLVAMVNLICCVVL